MRHRLPERGQRVHGVEHASKKGCRHNQKILKGSELIKFFCPNAGDEPHGTENGGAQQRE